MIIKEGELSLSLGEIYNQLYNLRSMGDYSDFIELGEEQVAPLVEQTLLLIDEIKKLINNDAITN